MTLAKAAVAVLSLGALATLSQSAIAQQFGSSDFVIVAVHVDNVRGPKDPLQTAGECSNSPVCSALATAIASSTGIPIDKMISAAALFATQTQGELTTMTIGLPTGYAYCSSSMTTQSIVPNDGDRGSTFLGRADANALYSETWTPVLPMLDGQSWVEGDLTVVGIRSDLAQSSYANGKCHAPGPGRIVFYCRGGGCKAGAVDRGRSVDASSPPAANSSK